MDNKFKDRAPIDTIKKIRDHLYSLDITVIEDWKVDYTGLYSVYLSISGTKLYANGKGTSYEFALASGYAELIERLHNLAMFRFKSTIFDRDKGDDIAAFAKMGSYRDYHKTFKRMLDYNPYSDGCEITEEDIINYSKAKVMDNHTKLLQFKSLDDNSEFEIPVNIVDYLFGSNGMVAGNSKMEAYVQGLSEILERYVIKEIYSSKITPPELDDSFLKALRNYEDINEYKTKIEGTGRYKIELKDLSLGKNIPAIGLILYDLANASYFIKAGVHPDISIAVERCFTELMQGQLIGNMRRLIGISETSKKLYNICDEPGQVTPEDIAPFPINFFTGKEDYLKSTYQSFKSNTEMSEYLVKIIRDLGFKIFVLESTRCDIRVYQFIVPGMSELNNYKLDTINRKIKSFEIEKVIKEDIISLTAVQAKKVLSDLEELRFEDMAPMSVLIPNMHLVNDSIYDLTPIIIFKAKLFLVLKDYGKSFDCIIKYNTYLKHNNKKNIYFDCFATLLSFLAENKELSLIKGLLHKFYSKQIVENVINDFNKPPFTNFPIIKCNDICESCDINKDCLRKNELTLYNRLKTKLLISQVPLN